VHTELLRELWNRCGGSIFDNSNEIYPGHPAINRLIPRHPATARFDQEVEITGKVDKPVLALHNYVDELVPVETTRHYMELTNREGTAQHFVQLYTSSAGHCMFQPAELYAALRLLDHGSGKTGARPRPGDLLHAEPAHCLRLVPMTTFVFPGQGSQSRGMGKALFGQFPELTAAADAILGYSIEELCSRDPGDRLGETRYTQPALYVVNAFSYLCKVAESGRAPDFLAGHSLGEYSALFASGAVDFETGLRLVQTRGQLMSEAGAGAMVAVIGLDEDRINTIMAEYDLRDVDIANYNAPAQLVVSGLHADLVRARATFEAAGATCIPLNVSAAFHSRHMQAAGERFGEFLGGVRFSELNVPVISNVHARPHAQHAIRETLQAQITRPVRWTHSIAFLLEQGETEFEEVGPGNVLTKLLEKIRRDAQRRAIADRSRNPSPGTHKAATAIDADLTAESLGSPSFRRDFNVKYAYVAGSMYKGIASKELVVRMGKAGLLACSEPVDCACRRSRMRSAISNGN
jgi:malonyl CoA-acyl carrier protein transacylase